MVNGIYSPNEKLSMISESFFENNLITGLENNIIQYILSKGNSLGQDEYDSIYNIFREHRILRWTDEEILKGSKILPTNKKIMLRDALTHQTAVKIDMISEVGGRLVEITNFLQLAYEDGGEMHIINIDIGKVNNIPVALPIEIEKLYFSNMHYSPFKMIKRMYALARHNMDKDLLYKVIPFVSSNTSLLYQIKSEIDTIILILERINSYPKKTIHKEMDEMKLRISMVLELSEDDLITVDHIIDQVNLSDERDIKIILLKELKKYIVSHINMQTIGYLEKVGLNPPPHKYLPPTTKYNTQHVRGKWENPENPYKKYVHIVEEMRSLKGEGYNVYYPTSDHYPNFFEDPNSSMMLSQRIISNPGLNDVPREDAHVFEPGKYQPLPRKYDRFGNIIEGEYHTLPYEGEGGTREGAWWASFLRKYRKEMGENPPVNYVLFKKIIKRYKKYNYDKIKQKIYDSIEFIDESEMAVPEEELRRPIGIPEGEFEGTRPGLHEGEFEYDYRNDYEVCNEDRNQMYDLYDGCLGRENECNNEYGKLKKFFLESNKEHENEINEIYNDARLNDVRNLKAINTLEDELERCRRQKKGNIEGKGGQGSMYAHNYRMPLYMTKNLPVYKLIQSNMHERPLTGDSYATDYYNRGSNTPSLKGVHIVNAPFVMDGKIVSTAHASGCLDCPKGRMRFN